MEALNRLFSDGMNLGGEVLRRLLELPALGVALGGVLVVSALFALLAWRRSRSGGSASGLVRTYSVATLGVFLLSYCLLIDQKLSMVMHEVRQLDAALRLSSLGRGSAQADPARLFRPAQVERALEQRFGALELEARALNAAMDLAVLRLTTPQPVVAFLTVVDLTHPEVRIEITPERGDKLLTSRFAQQHDCTAAINGEAGVTPQLRAPLGKWTGNWIVRGRPLLLTDGAQRPFLSFDPRNRGRYSVASIVDREPSVEKYNTLWGRFDLLVDGQIVQHRSQRNTMRGPRTLLAIDSSGDTLYMMIVDGRQPGYSMGTDLSEAAFILRSFGASDGMSCDEGGSSTLYLAERGAVVNRPSAGSERPVYTHFGVGFGAARSRVQLGQRDP